MMSAYVCKLRYLTFRCSAQGIKKKNSFYKYYIVMKTQVIHCDLAGEKELSSYFLPAKFCAFSKCRQKIELLPLL